MDEPGSDGPPRITETDRAGLVIVWMSGGILVILAIVLTLGYGLALGHSWLRLGFMLALSAMLLSAAALARRSHLPGFGLVVYLVSFGLLSYLLPLLVGGLTQTGGPASPMSGLGALIGAVVVFGAASLYHAGWDAPPLSAAVTLAGALVVLRLVQALPISPRAALWIPIAYGALAAVLAAARSLHESDADHAFWVALAGLGIVSVALPAVLPWQSAPGWLYPPIEVLLGLLFLRVGRRFLGVIALSAAAAFLADRAAGINAFLGVIVGLALVGFALLFAAYAFRESARSGTQTHHGHIWTR